MLYPWPCFQKRCLAPEKTPLSAPGPRIPRPSQPSAHLVRRTVQACRVATEAASAAAEGIATGSLTLLNSIRQRERELDTFDMEIDSGVTSVITQVTGARSPRSARLHEVHDRARAHRRLTAQLRQ